MKRRGHKEEKLKIYKCLIFFKYMCMHIFKKNNGDLGVALHRKHYISIQE